MSGTWTTPERVALAESVARFTQREIVPSLAQWEDDGRLPRELSRTAADAGILGVGFAEEVGGQGGDAVDTAVVTEALLGAFDLLDRPNEVGLVVTGWAERLTVPDPDDDRATSGVEVAPALGVDELGSRTVVDPDPLGPAAGEDVARAHRLRRRGAPQPPRRPRRRSARRSGPPPG